MTNCTNCSPPRLHTDRAHVDHTELNRSQVPVTVPASKNSCGTPSSHLTVKPSGTWTEQSSLAEVLCSLLCALCSATAATCCAGLLACNTLHWATARNLHKQERHRGGRASHLVMVWLMFCFSGTSSTVPARMCFSEYCTCPLQITGNGAHRTGVC